MSQAPRNLREALKYAHDEIKSNYALQLALADMAYVHYNDVENAKSRDEVENMYERIVAHHRSIMDQLNYVESTYYYVQEIKRINKYVIEQNMTRINHIFTTITGGY
jgi:hypothetical protein